MNCTTQCLCCESIQDLKINYALVHGLCSNHTSISTQGFIACIHCNATVPINKLTKRSPCDSCPEPTFLTPCRCGATLCLSHSSPDYHCGSCQGSDKKCEFCSSSDPTNPLPCKHNLCNKCLYSSNSCIMCDKIARDCCMSCKQLGNLQTLACGHKLCNSCFSISSPCNICVNTGRLASRRSSFVQELRGNCIDCLLF